MLRNKNFLDLIQFHSSVSFFRGEKKASGSEVALF